MSSSVELSFTVPTPFPTPGKAGNAVTPSASKPFAGMIEEAVADDGPAKDGSETNLPPIFAFAPSVVVVEPHVSTIPAVPATTTPPTGIPDLPAPITPTLPVVPASPTVPAFSAALPAQAQDTVETNTAGQPAAGTASDMAGMTLAITAGEEEGPTSLPLAATSVMEVSVDTDRPSVEVASRVHIAAPKIADPIAVVSADTALHDLHEATAQKLPSPSTDAIVESKVVATASAVITDETATIVTPGISGLSKAATAPLLNADQRAEAQGAMEGKPDSPASSNLAPIPAPGSKPHIAAASPFISPPDLVEATPSPQEVDFLQEVDRPSPATAETVNVRDPNTSSTTETRLSSPTSPHIVLPESVMSPKPAPVGPTQPMPPGAFNTPLPTVTAAIATEIVAHHRLGSSSFDIRLDPPELGRIDVRLDVDHTGRVRSTLIVERIETLDMLRSDVKNLERALEQAGLRSDPNSVSLGLRDDRNGSGQNGRAFHQSLIDEAPVLKTETLAAAITAATTRPSAASGLDIRV